MPDHPKPFRRGTVITARNMNRIIDAVFKTLVGGKDIIIRRQGNKIVIEYTGTQIIPKT